MFIFTGIILLIFGIGMCCISKFLYDKFDSDLGLGAGITTGIVCCALSLVVFICYPVNLLETASFVKQYEAVKISIYSARNNSNSDIERAALAPKIIDINQKLADYKYWRTIPIIKETINPKIDTLEYLK